MDKEGVDKEKSSKALNCKRSVGRRVVRPKPMPLATDAAAAVFQNTHRLAADVAASIISNTHFKNTHHHGRLRLGYSAFGPSSFGVLGAIGFSEVTKAFSGVTIVAMRSATSLTVLAESTVAA